MKKIQTTLIANQITTTDSDAYTLLEKSNFGTKLPNKISYSPHETLYLLQTNKITIQNFQNKPLTEPDCIKKFTSQNKNFTIQYPVFKDLTEKGYSVKTALKFGTDFRVYTKTKPKTTHAKWLCQTIQENTKITPQTFSAKNRVANSTNKDLLLAIVDNENKITYYTCSWTQP
jgi:tRNA-intron endonuclease, archaea type